MKRIAASVGLVTLGAASVHAAYAPGLSDLETTKPWSMSATLRGFYDDNVNNTATKRDTYGFEISPSVNVNLPLDQQTQLSLAYIYSFKYYDKAPLNDAEKYDQTHSFNAALDHAFSPRYNLGVRDSFVIGQEPDFLRAPNTPDSAFQRISGDNIRNYGAIVLNAQMTRLFGIEVGYANSFYDYADHFDPTKNVDPFGNILSSNAGTLNRLEHLAHLDTRWQILPQTVGVVGYQYGETDYTANEPIGGNVFFPNFFPIVMSDVRNSRSHYGYVGVDQNFSPALSASVRGGVQYIDFPNDPNTGSDVTPYGMASLKYAYATASSAELGFTYNRSTTSRVGYYDPSSFTTDASTAVVFASLNHRITPKLFGSVTGQFQNSTYHGGSINDETERYYLVGLNLEYRFNPNFSAQVGYNYDKLDSGLTTYDYSYDRDRIYLGVTASY